MQLRPSVYENLRYVVSIRGFYVLALRHANCIVGILLCEAQIYQKHVVTTTILSALLSLCVGPLVDSPTTEDSIMQLLIIVSVGV